MPLLTASLTSSQPPAWAAAARLAAVNRITRGRRGAVMYSPSRMRPRRCPPGALANLDRLLREQVRERPVALEQHVRRALLGDAAVDQHHGAVRGADGGEPLRRDQHRPA